MRKHLLIIAFALTSSFLKAQNVNIPDANFLRALIEAGVDKNNDKLIQTSEAQVTKTLLISQYQIGDMTGIEAFSALDTLSCAYNYIGKLDVSKNTELTFLVFYINGIQQIDLSKNTKLKHLNCNFNHMTKLDVSKNSQLTYLDCGMNSLTFLDVSQNTLLENLTCNYNETLSTVCINQDQANKYTNLWLKGGNTGWSTSCGTVTNIEQEPIKQEDKTLLRIYNTLGQEIKPDQATDGLFIYQYIGGSVKKVMKKE